MSDPFVGEIKMFVGNFVPRGYAMCNGQTLPLLQNPALYAILGTTFGGNGVDTVGLPDFRGRTPVGVDSDGAMLSTTLGQKRGAAATMLISSNLPAHSHPLNVATSDAEAHVGSPTAFLAGGTDKDVNPINLYGGVITTSAPLTPLDARSIGLSPTTQQTSVSLLNPSLGINMIIALVGEFPSRS
ncbi:phage tail protein [Pseudomonas sp.]|uniref:phage tail protein n=1 Tax=Pseudomonas sp. TaxID=306 RepID=UPI003D6EA8BA